MKTIVLYGSTRGSTRRIVSRLGEFFHFPYDVVDVRDVENRRIVLDYDLLVFFCPAYGDDEMQEDMERFIQSFDVELQGRHFAVCRIGSYDGYGYFEPAGGRILREELLDHGGVEAVEALSLDAMPKVDTRRLEAWCTTVDAWVRNRCQTNTS